MSFLSELNWRNAAKQFDSEKKVPTNEFQKILDAIRLAPSSFGLQPYHIHVITDKTMLIKIRENAWNQEQITECSHLLVFSSRTDTAKTRIDQYMELATGGSAEAREKMSMYEGMMRKSFETFSEEKLKSWADRQTYIALGFAMAACAELKIDSCPMEGFTPEKVDEVLGLPDFMKSVVLLTIGYRKNDPQHPKVRFDEKDLFTKESQG